LVFYENERKSCEAVLSNDFCWFENGERRCNEKKFMQYMLRKDMEYRDVF
jgi:hypothetical protein